MFRQGPGSGAGFRIHDLPTSTGIQTKVLKAVHRRCHGVKRHTSYPSKPDPDRLCGPFSAIELGAEKAFAHPSLPLAFNPLNNQTARFLENHLTDMAKRSREDTEVTVETPYTDVKKPRTLPFRTSPTSKHGNLFSQTRSICSPSVLTPAESEDGSDADSLKYDQAFSTRLAVSSYSHADDANSDFEMVDSELPNSPPWIPAFPTFANSASGALNSISLIPKPTDHVQQLSITSTRIPTPIYGHFNVSFHESAMGTPIQNGATFPEMSLHEPTSHNESHHDLFLRRRRLPTPIDENADMESPTTVTGSMFRNLDMGATSTSQFRPAEADMMMSDTPHFDMGTPATIPTNSGQAAVMTGSRDPTSTASINPAPFSEDNTNVIASDHPVRPANTHLGSDFRNKRRGAVVEGSTLKGIIGKGGTNPGGKIGFHMGFRSDCEKCQSRVPGHYAHFLRYD